MPSFFAVTSESSTIRSVRVKPGRSVFTVTPKGATSVARVRANPITAARMLLESIRLSTGCLAAIEPTLRILPQRRSFIPGSATRQNSTTLPRTSAVAWSHASAVSDSNGPAGGPPLLVSRMSIRPNRASPPPNSRPGGGERREGPGGRPAAVGEQDVDPPEPGEPLAPQPLRLAAEADVGGEGQQRHPVAGGRLFPRGPER